MFQLCLILAITQLLTTSRCDICDPDIPSRTLKQNIQNDFVLLGISTEVEPEKCDPGHFRDRAPNVCTPCPDGGFITRQMSEARGYWSCESCLKPDDHQNEIIAVPCNHTRDTTILCKAGYFREQVQPNRCDWSCKPCTVCGTGTTLGLIVARSCGNYSNTICCKVSETSDINGTCVAVPSQKSNDSNIAMFVNSDKIFISILFISTTCIMLIFRNF